MASRDKWKMEEALRMLEQYRRKYSSLQDPHKNNPEPIRGGCGDPRCPICYDQRTGELKGDGRYQGVDNSGPSEYYYDIATDRVVTYSIPSEPEALLGAREQVKQWLIEVASTVAWEDVIGNETAKEELREAIEASSSQKELYEFYSMKPPKGVLLWGPPGCGKTMLGKATASALSRIYKAKKAELMVLNGAELESPIVGIAAEKVRRCFTYAREYAKWHKHPLVMFIDEADAMLKSRETAPWTAELVGQFLAEMDGLKEAGAFIILATNRPDELDEALLREGRIDRKIKITRPSLETAKLIAKGEFKGAEKWLKEGHDGEWVERLYSAELLIRKLTNPATNVTHHFNMEHIVSGAMVVGVVARAKRLAFRRDKERGNGKPLGVTIADLERAIVEVWEENKELSHDYAMREFVEERALPMEEELQRKRSYN